MNSITLVGNLGRDPEVKATKTGGQMILLNLAVKLKKGGDEVSWFTCYIFDGNYQQFKRMMPYMKKGSHLYVQGKLMTPGIYTTKNGDKKISLQLIVHNLEFMPSQKVEKTEGYKSFEPKEASQGQKEETFQEDPELPF